MTDDIQYATAALRAGVSFLEGFGVTQGARIGMMREAIERLSMPMIEMQDDFLIKIETGETISWGEFKERQNVKAIGAGREEALRRLTVLRDQARNGTPVTDPNEWEADELDAILAALSPASPAGPELTVWYGKMPESNGRENWTAELRRVHPIDKWDRGFCFARSEYPGRVLYEADRVRWIIGERAERPDILAYDADAHSGYVEPASPERTPMGEPVAWIERQNDGTRYGEPKRWPPSDRARSYAQEMGRTIEPLYAAASPARTPMGGPQVLKGVGKINGDGWKDTTSIGEVVYVWNAEKPSPYAPGQYPRIGNEGWSASTAQYDFSPASVDEVRALAAPTPMGGEVEALREALREIAALPKLSRDPADDYCRGVRAARHEARQIAECALAASSPSPARGGEFDALEDWEHDDQRELSRLYRHRFDDSLQFNRGQMRTAIRHGRRIAASPQPEAGEAWAYAARQHEEAPWTLFYVPPHPDAWSEIVALYAAPPSAQPVEGK